MSLPAPTSDPLPTGPAWAAILAAATGCATLGVLATLTEASPRISKMLAFYNPSGDLSGKSTIAVIVWIMVWVLLHACWKNRTMQSPGKIFAAALILILLGMAAVFPPFMELFQPRGLMRYIMKQKLFSWGNDFTIRDADGNDVYFLDGKVLSLRDRVEFQDMQGNELAVIQRRLLAWGPTYEITHQGEVVAVVKESLFTLLGHRFSVDDQYGPNDLEARGNFTSHQYSFTRGGGEVAQVSESWFTIADTYGVDIPGEDDHVLILACTVVIERCEEEARRR